MWIEILQSRIFAAVKNGFPDTVLVSNKSINKENINFTTTDENDGAAVFPTIKIKLLPFAEQGKTLDNTEISAVLATVQVDVTMNTSEFEAQMIGYKVMSVLKSMRFSIPSGIESSTDNKKYKAYFRASRVIGNGDTL